ncbi:MAG: hypothetical protein H0U28_03630 [Nocardioidaceae bacterium]|nr:hypothetical protein [Nocardioidaceae bacterium]
MTTSHAPRRRYLSASPFNTPPVEPPVEVYQLRDRVCHDRYGLGSVVGVETDDAILVDFGSTKRRLTSPYPKLVKL